MTEEIEVVLKELMFDDRFYDYSIYRDDLKKELDVRDSFTVNFLLDKCLYYGISPIFIYLIGDRYDDYSLSLIFEVSLLNKNKFISESDFLDLFDLIISRKKNVSEIAKITLGKMKFAFTSKSIKKNALFAYKELLFNFRAFPMLDSCSLLTKEPSSIKIQPSTLVLAEFNISRETVKNCLNSLKSSKSRMIIFSSLNKIMMLYDSDLIVREMVSELDYNSLSLSDFYSVIDDILLEIDKEVELGVLC